MATLRLLLSQTSLSKGHSWRQGTMVERDNPLLVPYVEITKLPAVLQEAGEKNIFPCYRVKLGKHSDAGKSYTKLPSGNVSTNSHNHKMVYHGLPMEALRDRFVVEAVDMKRGCEHVQIGSCAVDIAQILDEAFFTNEATGHKMHIQLCNGGERVGTACVYVYYHIDEEAARKLAPNVCGSEVRPGNVLTDLKKSMARTGKSVFELIAAAV